MRGLTRSASLSSFGEVARKAGLDPNALLREFDLPQRCLTEPELRIPVDSVRRLLEAAADRSGVEGFGLRMAQARLLSDMGPLGLLMREQPTLRHALEVCANYANRLNAALYFTIEESPSVVVLREDLILGRPGPLRQSAELAMGVVFRVLQTFMGPQWRPLRVCFSHDAPTDRTEHDRLFGMPGRVRSRIQRHRLFEPRSRRRESQCRSGARAPGAPDAGRLSQTGFRRADGTGAAARGEPSQHWSVHDRSRRAAPRRRPAHRSPAPRAGRRNFSQIVAGVRRELADGFLKDPNRNLAELSSPRVLLAQRLFPLASSTVRKNGLGAAHRESRCRSQAADPRTQQAALSAHAPSPKDK